MHIKNFCYIFATLLVKQSIEGTKSPLVYLTNKMISKKIIEDIVKQKIDGTDIYIVDITISSSNKIIIEIDKPDGILISDCLAISRQVESNLDREKEDFELMVSSPGIDQPFKILKQYQKYIGKKIVTKTISGNKYSGVLEEANKDQIIISEEVKEKVPGKSKKISIKKEHIIPFNDIKETKLVITF